MKELINKIKSQVEETNHKLIMLCYSGSYLYGTNMPESDLDIIGIFMPTKEEVFGFQKCEQLDLSINVKDENGKNTKDAIDIKLYEFRKFIKLAQNGNPNIFELLFINDNVTLYKTEEWDKVISNRDLFISRSIVPKFLGYAKSQKHKMLIKTDNFHKLNEAYDYLRNYKDQEVLLVELKDEYLPFIEFNGKMVQIGDLHFEKNKMIKQIVKKIKERLDSVGNRKDLITKHGYDTKYMSHLIRLLSECIEILKEGKLEFPLQNSEMILDFKKGKYTFKEGIDYAEILEKNIQQVNNYGLIFKVESEEPDYKKIHDLCIQMISNHICIK